MKVINPYSGLAIGAGVGAALGYSIMNIIKDRKRQ
jgi:hypothetical protein